MPAFFTPRRILAYGAYFSAATGIIIALVLGPHAWRLQKTIWHIEKYWATHPDHAVKNATWLDKAGHALLAGHEDVSEYNDLYWEKYKELREHGEFDRSNLTRGDDVIEWASANAENDKWGFVLYRIHYDDEETWPQTLQYINQSIRVFLELDATIDGKDRDPDHVRDRATLEVIEDRELLDYTNVTFTRDLWRKRVEDGLVDAGMKMGGWSWGWFKLRLNSAGDDSVPKSNGMALNLCLVYDSNAAFSFRIHQAGFPATGPRDPWEPFLLAIDGSYTTDGKYMQKTSWAHYYQGYYGVALSLLFTDFHQATYEREMEKSAPYMTLGKAHLNSESKWWERFFYATVPAVARPGRFPFDNRLIEILYPYVREDSRWSPEIKQKNEEIETAEKLRKLARTEEEFARWYPLCEDTDGPDDCFWFGSLKVKKPKLKPETENVLVASVDVDESTPDEMQRQDKEIKDLLAARAASLESEEREMAEKTPDL